MLCRLVATVDIVATHRVAGLLVDGCPPDHESSIGVRKRRELLAVFNVVPVAQENEPVCAVARLVLDMPVIAKLLQGDQDVVSAPGSGSCDLAKHGKEEWIDERVFSFGFIKKEQRDRVALVCS